MSFAGASLPVDKISAIVAVENVHY